MSPAEGASALVVECDRAGVVTRCLETPDAPVFDRLAGAPLARIVDSGSLSKALRMLRDAGAGEASAGTEIDFRWNDDVHTLVAVAIATAEGYVVVATEDPRELRAKLEALVATRPDLETVPDLAAAGRDVLVRTAPAIKEMTRINNRMAAMQRELTRKSADLERTDRRKNELIGMIAHDLRNPINSVALVIEVLSRNESLDEGARLWIERLRTTAESMKTLIDDVLDVSAIESGVTQLRTGEVDIHSLVEREVEMARLLGAGRGVSVDLYRSDDPACAVVDEGKIEQVMRNLLDNALRFSPEHGRVEVRVSRGADRAVRIEVADAGPGIPQDRMDEIFEPFIRGDDSGTGIGLGLAIARSIVLAHGGSIRARNRPDGGAAFQVTLPNEQHGRGGMRSEPDVG